MLPLIYSLFGITEIMQLNLQFYFTKQKIEMGCIQSTATIPRALQPLKLAISKLKHSANFKKERTEQELKQNEKEMVKQFLKQPASRSKSFQRTIIISNAKLFNLKLIYMQIQSEAMIILQKKNLLQKEQNVPHLKDSLNMLLYISSFLNFQDLYKFVRAFKQQYPKYPEPQDKDINNEMIKAYKNNQVLFQSELEYISAFSHACGIGLDKINQVGHNYKYGATHYQNTS